MSYNLNKYRNDLQNIGLTNETDMITLLDYLYALAEIGVELLKNKRNTNYNE